MAPSLSTNTTRSAPRESISKPSAPVPAYSSSTRPAAMAPRASSSEATASRTRSAVGRVALPMGVRNRRPPSLPPTMRMCSETQTCPQRGLVRCKAGLQAQAGLRRLARRDEQPGADAREHQRAPQEHVLQLLELVGFGAQLARVVFQ